MKTFNTQNQNEMYSNTALQLAPLFEQLLSSNNVNDAQLLSIFEQFQSKENKESAIPKPPIKYPVFQGGGAKGNAYIGAYQALDEQGYLDEVTCPGGASAGGIVAFFMALGFTGEQFDYASQKMNFVDFTDLKKDGWGAYLDGNKIGIALDLITQGAAFSGENFHRWASHYVEQILGNKNATFKDLHEQKNIDPTLKDLLLVATHYGTKDSIHAQQVFSFETTPHVVLADALRATMSFPGAFAPWEVREKVDVSSSGEPTFKSLGFFADGGILNNFPIDSFNSKQYRDQHYDFVERTNEHGKPVQINPCALGLSLTTLEELDETITPFSAKIKLAKNCKTNSTTTPQGKTEKGNWHYSDLAKAGIWNTYGKPEVENVQDKHKMYFDQTIQIWPEDITTLEFDLSKERFSRLTANGKNATQLWLDKFRNQSQEYANLDDYRSSLTRDQEREKQQNPQLFYTLMLKAQFTHFAQEMNKMKKQSKDNDSSLLTNVSLRFIVNQIFRTLAQAKDMNVGLTGALTEAATEYQKRQKLIEANRTKRWELLVPEKVVDKICDKMYSEPKIALRTLKGQLSNVITLSQVSNSRLLARIVKNNDVQFATKSFDIIQTAIKQKYHQGKIENPESIMNLLLNANPTILNFAIDNNNKEMIQLLISLGIDPSLVDVKTKACSLEHAIDSENFEMFQFILTTYANQNAVVNLKDAKSIIHSVFERGTPEFIKQVCKNPNIFSLIFNSSKSEQGKNIFHHLAKSGCASTFCNLSFEAMDKGMNSLLTDKDSKRNSPLAYLLQNNRCDILDLLTKQGKGKNKGYLWNSDYHLDDIFQIGAQRDNYRALVEAHSYNPRMVKSVLDNFGDKELASKIRSEIALNSSTLVNQPTLNKHDVVKIQHADVLLHQFDLNKMPQAMNDTGSKHDKKDWFRFSF